MKPPTPEEERLAEEMVAAAMRGLDPHAPPEVLKAIRELLLDEVLWSPQGRSRLRQCCEDPVVQRSGDVDRGPSEPGLPKKGKLG